MYIIYYGFCFYAYGKNGTDPELYLYYLLLFNIRIFIFATMRTLLSNYLIFIKRKPERKDGLKNAHFE